VETSVLQDGEETEHITRARPVAAADARRSLRPKHVGHVLEWMRTFCAVAAVTLQCVVLVVLLAR
jgi:hypothetical protein